MSANLLQQKIIKYFKDNNGAAALFKVAGQRGQALDVYGVKQGKTYIIEVKQYYEKSKDDLSKVQNYQMDIWKKAGAIVFAVYTYTDFLINMEMEDVT